MRAIDSLISLCEKYQQDLTIIWVNNAELNCSFNKIFVQPSITSFKFNIIECPNGFPETYINLNKKTNQDYNFISSLKNFKNRLIADKLNTEQEKVKCEIKKIQPRQIISNKKLAQTYSSQKQAHLMLNETDKIFFTNINSLIIPLLQNKQQSCFIESCYRIHPRVNNYTHFTPIEHISKAVNSLAKQFNNTIGLHIRRTDHASSIKYSNTNKFIELINSKLKTKPETTFFLATDDQKLKEKILNQFGEKIITNNVTSFSRNNESAIIQAVIDLYCLSKTKQIYGSHHSTFSQTAADIGQIKEFTIK